MNAATREILIPKIKEYFTTNSNFLRDTSPAFHYACRAILYIKRHLLTGQCNFIDSKRQNELFSIFYRL